MKEKINIVAIAKGMNIRVKRLEMKAEKLGLTISPEGNLEKKEAQILLESFVDSLKTSNATKEQAKKLLKDLTFKNVPEASRLKKAPITRVQKRPNRTQKQQVNNDIWYKKLVFSCTDFCQTFFTPFQNLVQKTVKSCVQILEGLYFKFMALLVAIVVQMHHSANWFFRISPEENPSWAAALGYAFMVDLFILVVTMEGKLSIAKTFAILTFLANILYFQCWVGFDNSVQAYTDSISSVLISGIMAYIIYAYTELFVKYKRA